MRRSFGPLAVLCAATLAGCGHSSAKISSSNARSFVLTAKDLPSGFSAFAEGPTSTLDVQGTPRSSLQRFGREGGWVERLRRTAGGTRGPLLVVSTVDVFRDAKGARADLAAFGDGFALQGADGLAKRVVVPTIGDGATGARLAAPGGEQAFAVAWSAKNVTASVTVIGRGIGIGKVVELAQRQQAKLAAAGN
jgi:hypothetical protein